MQATSKAKPTLKLFDIAANLSASSFRGVYRGKQHHDVDFETVIKRANDYGVVKFLFAGGFLKDALASYELSLGSSDFYATIGVHPCRAKEPFMLADGGLDISNERLSTYVKQIEETIETAAQKDKYVAIGECGLDYDRFDYADKET